jgi:excisionase family DNA binding protein
MFIEVFLRAHPSTEEIPHHHTIPRDDRNSSPAIGDDLPLLATVAETAAILRTSRKAVYAMIERRQLPGITRIGRRVLIRTPDLLDWLRQKSAPSLER